MAVITESIARGSRSFSSSSIESRGVATEEPRLTPGGWRDRAAVHTPQLAVRREDTMVGMMKSLWNDESGATAVEYGLMVALIAVVIIVAVRALGGTLSDTFDYVEGEVAGAGGGS
jgi:pilus assembly protein Flp/PilA